MTPLHQAALAYAAQGLPIFPCSPGSKIPATAHGFKDATTDPTVINRWYAMGDWNIATEPGASGHYVIDIDDKNGKEGSKVWAALCAANGDPGPTLTIRTPSGGRHLWFKGKLPSSVGTAKRGLGDGIDVRSVGGYVLLPPSVIGETAYEGVDS